jgi:hypothetical protein
VISTDSLVLKKMFSLLHECDLLLRRQGVDGGFQVEFRGEISHHVHWKVCSFQLEGITFEGRGSSKDLAKNACALVMLARWFPASFCKWSEQIKNTFGIEVEQIEVGL